MKWNIRKVRYAVAVDELGEWDLLSPSVVTDAESRVQCEQKNKEIEYDLCGPEKAKQNKTGDRPCQ